MPNVKNAPIPHGRTRPDRRTLPGPARAAYYVATYAASITSGGSTTSPSWNNNSGSGSNSPAHPTSTLTITATLTWTLLYPGDPQTTPPTSVTVQEAAQAQPTGSGPPGAGVSADDDGFGDGPGGTATPVYQNGVVVSTNLGGNSQGTHLTTMPGSSVITLPQRTMTLTYSGGASGAAAFGYAVSISPYGATVDLAGATPVNGTQEALTGQPISATLALSGVTLNTAASPVYQWSTTGGSPFETWDTAAPGDGEPTQLVPLSATDKAGPVFGFYDATNKEQVYVTCTAAVKFPNGTTGTVSAKSQPVTFMKPTATWTAHEGYPQGFTYKGTKPGDIDIGLLEAPNSGYMAGMAWPPGDISITVPSGFSGTGSACVAQFYKPNRTFTENGSQVPQPGWVNGTQGLDEGFPYQGVQWAVPGGSPPADFGDSPYTGVAQNSNTDSNTGKSVTEFTDSDSVSSWLMYLPPGTNCVWVPLSEYDWNWSETVDWTGKTWAFSSSIPAQNSATTKYTPRRRPTIRPGRPS